MTMNPSVQSIKATPPWFSIDAKNDVDDWERLPQQSIDVCLMCQHCASACDRCDGTGNLREERGRPGRPKKEIDTKLLMEMMKLKRCNAECCAALGISNRTLVRAKNKILRGELS